MQIFLPFKDVYKTAICLDPRRLNKQIIECKQILNVYRGISKAWMNHPITKMYKNYSAFIEIYMHCLIAVKNGHHIDAQKIAMTSHILIPSFITDEYCDNMKRRLYTKDPIFYKDFAIFGKSYENWYFDIENNNWKIYKQNN